MPYRSKFAQPPQIQAELLRTPRNKKFWAKRSNYHGHERTTPAFRSGDLIFPGSSSRHVLEVYDRKTDTSTIRSARRLYRA